jgi:hypothetical protein
MRTTLSTGDYATIPYYIPGLEIPVYCIEELAFCMRDNAFMLDMGIMNDELIEWISGNLGLKDLSAQLYPMVHKKGTLGGFVLCILEYTGLFDISQIRETSELLKKNAGLSSIEKRKEKTDMLTAERKFAAAVRGYDALLSKWDENDDASLLPAPTVKASIYHNKGVALTGMMRYKEAAESFLESYYISNSQEEYTTYLAAMRMGMSEREYIAFAAELKEGYAATLKLEKTMENLKAKWDEQPDSRRLSMRRELRNGADSLKYYEENERVTQALKENYRFSQK